MVNGGKRLAGSVNIGACREKDADQSRTTTDPCDWHFRARTPVWTGDADRKGERLITTGLLGSVRWWFEVLVRGLGGTACDPSDAGNRCPDKTGTRCVVCELFGCTGWARKFRFQALDASGKTLASAIGKGGDFRLRFLPLRPVAAEEWALLDLTLRLIAGYGAIGGRTVWKPTDEPARANAQHHQDYGLIELTSRPDLQRLDRSVIERYVKRDTWRKVDDRGSAWATLSNFWCVNGKYLARRNGNTSAFNKVLGRKEPKNQAQQLGDNSATATWLAGKQQESKKVFSFKDPARTFGFVKPGTIDFDAMRKRLKGSWPKNGEGQGFKDAEMQEGTQILEALLRAQAPTAE